MKVVILCGGWGTRLKEQTEILPKPLVTIGDRPILWHIMKIYSHYGFNDFILPLGYKGEMIKEYFINYSMKNSDFLLDLKTQDVRSFSKNHLEPWKIHFVDTGLDSSTGRRIGLIKQYLKDDDLFMVTYGDGVADIDLNKLVEFHKSKKCLATISGYNVLSRFGIVKEKDGIVREFVEKPKTEDLVNMGFMIFEKAALDYFNELSDMIEKDALVQLCKDGQLAIYHHKGFWFAMDTQREYEELNKLWKEDPKWKLW